MKRAIAGFLLLVGMAVAPAFAFDGGRDTRENGREDVRAGVRLDDARVAQDRYQFRRDLDRSDYDRDNYAAARRERFEQRRDYRDMNRERRDLNWDRR
jgi:hypothetical protein